MASKRMSKGQFVNAVAEKSGLSKKETNAALDAITAVVTRELSKRGPGEVVFPGLLKLTVVNKPATREHAGVNPFTKEPMIYKAKAARKVVKIRALKALTDAV
jgi:nucleoid DNA-binding protein